MPIFSNWPITKLQMAFRIPRVLRRPALDHNFLFRIELNCVASLPVLNAEKTVFPAAEREIRHGRGDPDIDADVACRRLVAKPPCGSTARSKQGCLISIGAALQKCAARHRGRLREPG